MTPVIAAANLVHVYAWTDVTLLLQRLKPRCFAGSIRTTAVYWVSCGPQSRHD